MYKIYQHNSCQGDPAVEISVGLADAIIEAIQKKPGLQGLQDMEINDLIEPMREIKLQGVFDAEDPIVDLFLSVLNVFPFIGAAIVKLSLPVYGEAKKQKKLHEAVVKRFNLREVGKVLNDGIVVSVLLSGSKRPVEDPYRKSKNGQDGLFYCTVRDLKRKEARRKQK